MRRALLPAVLVLSTQFAFGHHGAGTFDLSKSVTFKAAKFTRIDLINPHSWLYFDVTDKDGRIEHHRCEMRSVHVLRRSGWTKDLFPIGQRITVEASPDRADPTSCYLQTILFENGTRMDRYGQYVKAGSRRFAGHSSYRIHSARCGVRPASRTSRASGRRSRSSWSIRAASAVGWCRSAS
jgi:Family of unknown function (DUF6152)